MQKKEQSRKANAEGIGPGESAYLEIWFYPVNRYDSYVEIGSAKDESEA